MSWQDSTAHRNSRPMRRGLVATAGTALAVGLAFTPATATPGSAGPSTSGGQTTDLGVAMHSVNVRLSGVGELDDGTPVGYLFSDGEPVSFNMVDLRDGELLDRHYMEPYSVASAIDVAEDGTVHLSVRGPNDGTLWRYAPDTGELTELASGIAGEQMLRTLDSHGSTLYGATYPNANLFALDRDTDEITEFGRTIPEGDYAWGLHADDDEVWVGGGTPAQLISIDPAGGETTAVDLPEPVAQSGEFIQRVERYEDLRLISHRVVDGATAHVHDGEEWIDSLPVAGMWHYTTETADGAFYYLDSDDVAWGYDIDAREAFDIGLQDSAIAEETGQTSQVFLADLGLAEFPGSTLLGVRADGQIWRYNLETGHGDVVASQAEGAPVTIMSLAPGGDGQVYVGAYLSPGVMASIDPGTNTVTQLDGPEQADSITAHDDLTVIGTYPNAEFYTAEADETWEWGTNPRHVLTLGRDATGQDRPRHMTSAGDVVAAGTIPNYGELGGALTLFDPVTGESETHRDVVEDQSVTDLAYADGVVYGGTSIHGGLDSTPTQETAEIFAWDVQDGLLSSSAVPGAEVVHSIEFDGEGRLWAMTDAGDLVEYDTVEHEITSVIDSGIPHSNIWGTAGALTHNPADGHMYGNAGGRLFEFDPAQGQVDVLVSSGVQRSTVADSDVFYANETNVFRYHLTADEPVCDETIEGTHRGPLQLRDGTTCITDADLAGPITVAEGASLVLTDSTTRGPLRSTGAVDVHLRGNEISGGVQITGSTGEVRLEGNQIAGPLNCSGNDEAPVGGQNQVQGPASGQCASVSD